jgi:fucose 4-O-acetylase-like acetyltransferase
VTAWSTEFYRVPFVISAENFLATLGCAALFVLIAHGFVARSIRRMDWKSAINVME